MNMRSILRNRLPCKRFCPRMLRRARFVALAVIAAATWCRTAGAEAPSEPREWFDDNASALVELYRHWHRTPELSFAEKETATRLAAELQATGFTVKTGVGGHG